MTTQITEASVGAAFAEHHVEIEGFTVRYLEAGAGDPLVVLHGAGGPELTVALDLLAERHRVLLLEVPGFGAVPNDVHQSFEELAEAVIAAVDAIGVERFHLLGTSFGGALALRVALAHPERLVSMVLEGPAAFRQGATTPAGLAPEELVARFRTHPERVPAWTPPDPEKMARSWPLVERLLVAAPEYDEVLAARLETCAVRTLVLFGDRDGIVPAENGRTYRRLMPSCSFVLVYDAAHAVQQDRAEAFADLVGDFLARGWQFLLPEESTLINP